jgi:hypothetical protein
MRQAAAQTGRGDIRHSSPARHYGNRSDLPLAGAGVLGGLRGPARVHFRHTSWQIFIAIEVDPNLAFGKLRHLDPNTRSRVTTTSRTSASGVVVIAIRILSVRNDLGGASDPEARQAINSYQSSFL